jgi:hypothetical protein
MRSQAEILVREDAERGGLALLPKSVRLLGDARGVGGLYEFIVVDGNAAYSRGEHFFLTAAQARRAYFPAAA